MNFNLDNVYKVIDYLREKLDQNGRVDISSGTELALGVSRKEFETAYLKIVDRDENYAIFKNPKNQVMLLVRKDWF